MLVTAIAKLLFAPATASPPSGVLAIASSGRMTFRETLSLGPLYSRYTWPGWASRSAWGTPKYSPTVAVFSIVSPSCSEATPTTVAS